MKPPRGAPANRPVPPVIVCTSTTERTSGFSVGVARPDNVREDAGSVGRCVKTLDPKALNRQGQAIDLELIGQGKATQMGSVFPDPLPSTNILGNWTSAIIHALERSRGRVPSLPAAAGPASAAVSSSAVIGR